MDLVNAFVDLPFSFTLTGLYRSVILTKRKLEQKASSLEAVGSIGNLIEGISEASLEFKQPKQTNWFS
jgi:hypothetical protein